MTEGLIFNPECRACARLAQHLEAVRQAHPSYYARPVAPFGDPSARLLIVGLAPGLHGANATGRPFTGDFAGIILYKTLFEFGFSNKAESVSASDGLRLKGCRITNAVKCLPPNNTPLACEVLTCNLYLRHELASLAEDAGILVLGTVAHGAVLRALTLRPHDYPFMHGRVHSLPRGRWLLDSYHCSRYNTQTRRLTPEMFREVFAKARRLLDSVTPQA
jgi:Uracil-DNA glycosylase